MERKVSPSLVFSLGRTLEGSCFFVCLLSDGNE